MSKRVQIGESIKGSFRETEDWWHYVVEDNGSAYVEHEWSHTDPYRGNDDSGVKKTPVDEFLAGDASEGLKGELRSALKNA